MNIKHISKTKDESIKILNDIIVSDGFIDKFLWNHLEDGNDFWSFYLPLSFRLALSILDVSRTETIDGKTVKEIRMAQGALWDFCEGDVIYDSRKGYLVWSDALHSIELCLQVRSGLKAGWIQNTRYVGAKKRRKNGPPDLNGKPTFTTISKNDFVDDGIYKIWNKMKNVSISDKEFDCWIIKNGLSEKITFESLYDDDKFTNKSDPPIRNPGSITFDVFKPNDRKDKLEKREVIRCSQDDFVRLLITGKINNKTL